MENYSVARVLDCKGLACPMPIVKLSQEIVKLVVGQVLEVHTTDPGSLADIPAWAKTTGNVVLETKQEPGVIKFFVKRQK